MIISTTCKETLGQQLTDWLTGTLDFDEFISRANSNSELMNVRNEEIYKYVWHMIFQYQMDITSENLESVEKGTTFWMKQLAQALIKNADDEEIISIIDKYHGDPRNSGSV